MSSNSIREPDFRLQLGYPDIAAPRRRAMPLPSGPSARLALGVAALAASAAVAVALLAPGSPPTSAAPEAATAVITASLAPAAEVPEPAPRAAPKPQILRSAPPLPRPARAAPQPIVTLATRNVPPVVEEQRDRSPGLRLAELTTARARLIGAMVALPLQRPVEAAAAAAATRDLPDLRPAHRPVPAVQPPPATEAGERPRPRPDSVVVAALDPKATAAIYAAVAALPAETVSRPHPRSAAPAAGTLAPQGAAAIHAAVAVPLARPDDLRTNRAAPARPRRAEPVRVVTGPTKAPVPPPAMRAPAPAKTLAPARVVSAPAPKPVRVAAAPAPVRGAKAPAPKQVRAVAAPTPAPKVTRVQSQQPLRVASVAAPTPAASAAGAAATTRHRGFGRRDMALIGVFGSASERHALVRFPNGSVEKVRAGDRIQGVQVAAVGTDSVRLMGRRGETTLRLPD